jgi:hypothetical protein
VSLLSGTTSEIIEVYNTVPQSKTGGTSFPGSQSPPTAYQGPFLNSPDNAAGTLGEVVVNHANTFYYAETDQPGASCGNDFGGLSADCP